jgi:U3 small nucleolar RNA-associated protein 14
VEERLRLRHGAHSKFAKNLNRFKGKMNDEETKEAYHEAMRER